LNSGRNQGITFVPGRPIEAGRALVFSATAGQRAMPFNSSGEDYEKAQRFRDAALPYLDDAYTLARYLRALKHFDSYRGPAMKPWLFAILRNVCRAEYARRASSPTTDIDDIPEGAEQTPLWHEVQDTPETQMLRERDASAVQKIVSSLGEPFRETFVLREIHNLSYREIADIVAAPVGTVMSRLARARAMLRSAWMAQEEQQT
jgi:RNA polymerase sigma-70 factor (ECF subfamily)